VPSGEESDALGPDPFGYISYASDGRLMVFVLKSGRLGRNRIRQHRKRRSRCSTLYCYVGTYAVEDDRVIHTLDAAGMNCGRERSKLVYFQSKVEGLIYTTRKPLFHGRQAVHLQSRVRAGLSSKSVRPNHAFNRTRRYGPSIWRSPVAAGG